MGKFEDAKNRARGTQSESSESDASSVPMVVPMDLATFVKGVQAGGVMGETFLEIEENHMIGGFFLGTSPATIEEAGKPKEVTRMHFEYGTWKDVATPNGGMTRVFRASGVNFSLLEFAQLKNQISDVAARDGTTFVIMGKGPMGETKRTKRRMWQWITQSYKNARKARKELAAKYTTDGESDSGEAPS